MSRRARRDRRDVSGVASDVAAALVTLGLVVLGLGVVWHGVTQVEGVPAGQLERLLPELHGGGRRRDVGDRRSRIRSAARVRV